MKLTSIPAWYAYSLLLLINLLAPSLASAVNWHNSIVVASVTDDHVSISGINTLEGGIAVQALTQDIVMSVNMGDASIQGGTTDANGARLYLIANPGRTITLDLRNNLTFRGSTTMQDLLIITGGGGTVSILYDDNRSLILTSDATHGGVAFMRAAHSTPSAKTIFKRRNVSNTHVNLVVGPGCLMGYISPSAQPGQQARLVFEPTNTSRGRMVLRIKDTGALVISAYDIPVQPLTTLTYADIDFTTPANRDALFTIQQRANAPASAHAGLLLINDNKTLTDFISDPWSTGNPGNQRFGCILSNAGQIIIQKNSYLDYVATATNTCPLPTIPLALLQGRSVDSVVKERNASAFIVDGTTPATIQCATSSAFLLRSGSDALANINEFDSKGNFDFTIDPLLTTSGAGNIVLDIESACLIEGAGAPSASFVQNARKLELLSLQVGRTQGSVVPGSGETVFPRRSFAVDAQGNLKRYNKACMLVNTNQATFSTMCLAHTDENHAVFDKDDVTSEPTYIGGERATILNLTRPENRPHLAFINSHLLLNTSAALTGMDILVPEHSSGNNSELVAFYNGRAIDKGTGRLLILGTSIGSFACDGESVIDNTSNVIISQTAPLANATPHLLNLRTAANDSTITQGVDANAIAGQFSLHSLYLGNNSTIACGTFAELGSIVVPYTDTIASTFVLTTQPTLSIAGNYFAFETRGGIENNPEQSSITGHGGIYVNNRGFITIERPSDNSIRALINAMVTKTGSGTVDLPKSNVYFGPRMGIAEGNLNLSVPAERIIIPHDACFSDYTLYWPNVLKDVTTFVPYEVGSTNAFNCQPVTAKNITGMPIIQGMVEQFQIQGSRLGDAAQLLIDGGSIRELIFLQGSASGQAPVAVIALQDDAQVGLGSAERTIDSLHAAVMLGVNGITLIANGDAQVTLQQDCIINNTCHILAGPDFGTNCPQTLVITAPCCRSLIVKSGGVLDLSSFDTKNKRLEFKGAAQLVLEPGAIVLLNGGELIMSDETRIITGQPF